MDDLELLRAYAEHHSEEAFAELVERHVDLVYSTAVRIVPDADQARDVVQLVFSQLARHARDHQRITLLNGWLYRRTYCTALDLIRAETSRRARERTAMDLLEANAPEPSVWSSVAPLLEEGMSRLSPADQDAIVLRYLENRSLREVGVALGLSEDTAQKRVSRALKRLQEFLLRRGVTVSVVVLASSLASHALQAASPGLAASVSAAALASGPGGCAAVTVGGVGTLVKAPGAWMAISVAVLLIPGGFATFRVLRSGGADAGSPGINLVRNAGFEDGLEHWGENKGELSATPAPVFSGQAAVRVAGRLAPYAGPIQHLPVEAMQSARHFECAARVRIVEGPSQPVQVTLRYDDAEGTHYLTGARGRADAGAWSDIRGRFTLKPSGTLTFVDLFLEGPAPGVDFLVDEVEVRPLK